jgi:hypothetical protein
VKRLDPTKVIIVSWFFTMALSLAACFFKRLLFGTRVALNCLLVTDVSAFVV